MLLLFIFFLSCLISMYNASAHWRIPSGTAPIKIGDMKSLPQRNESKQLEKQFTVFLLFSSSSSALFFFVIFDHRQRERTREINSHDCPVTSSESRRNICFQFHQKNVRFHHLFPNFFYHWIFDFNVCFLRSDLHACMLISCRLARAHARIQSTVLVYIVGNDVCTQLSIRIFNIVLR